MTREVQFEIQAACPKLDGKNSGRFVGQALWVDWPSIEAMGESVDSPCSGPHYRLSLEQCDKIGAEFGACVCEHMGRIIE